MGTARLCLVPCGLVLLIDVFCWLEFYKVGCCGFVGLVPLPQKPFFHPLVGKGDMKSGFPGKSICCTVIGENVAESCS